jgi:hypothetical protein
MRFGFAPVGLCVALSWAAGCGGAPSALELDPSAEGGETGEFTATRARGISILEVEINQGTRVPIGVGSEWLDESERLAPLIASRDALMRVHFTVDEGWVPRQIEARLTLDFPDGSTASFSDLQKVEGDSDPGDLGSAFAFELAAAEGETVAEVRYTVELWETQAGGEPFDEGAWVNPAGGPQPIGFEAAPMQLKTVLVPITYQDTTANLDEATTRLLIDALHEQNPTSEIIYAIHDPVTYEGQLIDLANLLPIIAELRSSENAEPNVYYHALIDVGGSSIGGLHGISGIANDSNGDSGNRVSATVLWSPNPSLAANTFTHETGHAQGLSHVACTNADAAETDGAYPYADGSIGNWGYGIVRAELFAPDETYDYMSYCAPSWVSVWTWNKIHERIRTLTAWDFEGASQGADPIAEVLVVAVSADGRRQWWTMPGTIDPARVDGRERIEIETAGGEVIAAQADVSTLSDGITRWLEVPLPSDSADVTQVRHVRGDEITDVVPAAIEMPATSTWKPSWKIYRSR